MNAASEYFVSFLLQIFKIHSSLSNQINSLSKKKGSREKVFSILENE